MQMSWQVLNDIMLAMGWGGSPGPDSETADGKQLHGRGLIKTDVKFIFGLTIRSCGEFDACIFETTFATKHDNSHLQVW